MKKFIETMRELPLPVKVLLMCSMARSVCFFALLPFLPIYLHKVLNLDMESVGYVLGLCLLIGTLTSVYGGYLADRVSKVGFMIVLNVALAAMYAVLPIAGTMAAVLAILLAVNTASSCINVLGNALLSDLLPSDLRSKAFSIRYSLQNIGAAGGPFLGAWIAPYNVDAPFWLASFFTVVIFLLLAVYRRQFVAVGAAPAPSDEKAGFGQTLRTLRGDPRLMLFTLGGIVSMIVYGPLLTYLSQYLVVVKSAEVAYQNVAWVSAANAAVVIGLQYLIGSKIKQERLLAWVTAGSAAFALGLLGLASSSELAIWVVAVAVFTIGEVIVVPAEYMFIDSIAPQKMRGAYFGVQNLIYMGIAIGPAVCGFFLKNMQPDMMFFVLIGLVVLSWGFYILGTRVSVAEPAPEPVLVDRVS